MAMQQRGLMCNLTYIRKNSELAHGPSAEEERGRGSENLKFDACVHILRTELHGVQGDRLIGQPSRSY
jgi:hypothetical protein